MVLGWQTRPVLSYVLAHTKLESPRIEESIQIKLSNWLYRFIRCLNNEQLRSHFIILIQIFLLMERDLIFMIKLSKACFKYVIVCNGVNVIITVRCFAQYVSSRDLV